MKVIRILKNTINNFKNMIYNSIQGVEVMKVCYTVIIHKEENPDGYWAECKEVEGCFAQAKTIEEVKELMKKCIIMKLEENKNIEEIDLLLSYA